MKKLFSYVLALTLLVSTMSVAFAAPADVKDAKEAKAVDVLTALGVVNGYEDGTFRPDQVVTRAEMAKMIVVALGFEELAKGSTNTFTDASNHWAAGYIGACVGLGITVGYPDGSYKPNDTVTYAEAATMLLRALGWTDKALGGIWPVNYVSRAMSEEIFKDVDYKNAGAVRGDVAQLFFNTLTKEIGVVDQDGDYKTTDDDTMMSRLGATKVKDDAVYEGTLPTVGNFRSHIGEYSTLYTNKKKDKVVLVLNAATTLVGKVDGKKFVVSKDEKYDLTDAQLSDNVVHFTNAKKQTTDAALSTFNGETILSVDLKGKKIEKIHAASIWTVSKDAKITEDQVKELKNKNKLLGKKFKMKDKEIVKDSFELLGVEKLSDIKKDDIVYVYTVGNESDEVIAKIAVGTEVKEGLKISKRVGKKLTANGAVYEASKHSDLDFSDGDFEPSDKDEFTFLLDYYGKVYATKGESTVKANKYAYILAVDKGTKKTNFTEGKLAKVQLFLADGTAKIFDVKKASSDLFDKDTLTWEDAAEAQTPVKYAVNNEGQITALDKLTTPELDKATVKGSLVKKGSFEGTLTDKTAVFTFKKDGDKTKADDYGIMTLADLKKKDEVSGYGLVEKGNVSLILVSGSGVNNKDYVVITTSTQEEVVGGYEVPTFHKGEKKTYVTKELPTTDLAIFGLRTVTVNDGKATFSANPVDKDSAADYITTTKSAKLEGNIVKVEMDAEGEYKFLQLAEGVQIYTLEDDEVKVITKDDLASKIDEEAKAENANSVITKLETVDTVEKEAGVEFVFVTLAE